MSKRLVVFQFINHWHVIVGTVLDLGSSDVNLQ